MHLDAPPTAGPVAGEARLKLLDGYFAWRRAEDAGK
jgi:hypothetical protein